MVAKTDLLEISLFGGVTFKLGKVPLEGLASRRTEALLIYLVCTGRSHTRESLANFLWDEGSQSQVMGNLRVLLTNLRQVVGPFVTITRHMVSFNLASSHWLDVAALEQGLSVTQTQWGQDRSLSPVIVDQLAQALSLYRGDFLQGFYLRGSQGFEEWQVTERERLRLLAIEALDNLVQGYQSLGNYQAGLEQARRLVQLDPLRESTHRHLIKLLAYSGQRSAALIQYQKCCQILVDELGVEPMAETTDLYEAIKEGTLPPLPRSADKNSDRSVSISTHSPYSFEARHNLPAQAIPFTGRATELTALDKLIIDPDTRLITIIGPGGIGKTRLALEVARRELTRSTVGHSSPSEVPTFFADGVYFVSLAPICSADSISQAITEGLGVPLSTYESPEVQLLNYLRNKQILLVLDNFDHLLLGAGLVSKLLQSDPGVKILVTSRERLNLVGETVWTVTGLDFAEAQTPDEALSYDAVRLFVEAAKRVRPDYALHSEALPALNRIMQLLQGMPLAMHLAAAWVNTLSLAEIATEIETGLDFLETELQDVPDRHRSIRAVFEYSWASLPDLERSLFKSLSVFRAGFTSEAAQRVAGATLHMLAGLVNKSLLVSHPDTGRYEIHELLRQYAQEQLEADSQASAAAHEAHAAHFAEFMQQGSSHLMSHRQKETLAAIERDIENIRLAWRYALAERNSAQLVKFIDGFWLVHDVRGWHRVAIELFEETIKQLRPASGDVDTGIVLAKVKMYLGYFWGIIGNPEYGMSLAEEGAAFLRRRKRHDALGSGLIGSAINAMYLNDKTRLMSLAQEMNALAKENDDHWWEGTSLNFMASAFLMQGASEEASGRIEAARRIFEEINECYGLTWAALVQGGVALAQGNYLQAKDFYQRSLKAAHELNYRRPIQQCYDNLGDVAIHLNEIEDAERYFRYSLKISDETGQTREILGTLCDLARVWATRDEKSEAVRLLAIVLQHPTSKLYPFLRSEDIRIRAAAERLQAELKNVLDPETFQAALIRGQASRIEAVVSDLLDQAPDAKW